MVLWKIMVASVRYRTFRNIIDYRHFGPMPDQIYLENISAVSIYNTESYHAFFYVVETLYALIFQSLEELCPF